MFPRFLVGGYICRFIDDGMTRGSPQEHPHGHLTQNAAETADLQLELEGSTVP